MNFIKIDVSEFNIKLLENEFWTDAFGLNGLYIVSNMGRVYSLPRKSMSTFQERYLKGRMLNPYLNSYGQYVSHFYNNEMKYVPKSIHRIVAQSFLGDKSKEFRVHHKNGIKNDNRLENLEWKTVSEIANYAKVNGRNDNLIINEKQIIKPLEYEYFENIKGFGIDYKISNFGRVVSLKRGNETLLSVAINHKGYPVVFLSKDGKTKNYLIHRLIAIQFIPNPENKPQVNHINGIRTDFSISNLEWCTASENVRHSYDVLGKVHNATGMFNRCGKKVAQYDLDGKLLNTFQSTMDAERSLKISNTNISLSCKKNVNRSFGGFMFRYFDNEPIEKIDKYIKTPSYLSKKIQVISLKDNTVMEFNTITEGASEIKINNATLSKYLKLQIPYNGYFFKLKTSDE